MSSFIPVIVFILTGFIYIVRLYLWILQPFLAVHGARTKETKKLHEYKRHVPRSHGQGKE